MAKKDVNLKQALKLLKDSKKIHREGWVNAYLFRVSGDDLEVEDDECDGKKGKTGAEIMLRNEQGETERWKASKEDKKAKDWKIKT